MNISKLFSNVIAGRSGDANDEKMGDDAFHGHLDDAVSAEGAPLDLDESQWFEDGGAPPLVNAAAPSPALERDFFGDDGLVPDRATALLMRGPAAPVKPPIAPAVMAVQRAPRSERIAAPPFALDAFDDDDHLQMMGVLGAPSAALVAPPIDDDAPLAQPVRAGRRPTSNAVQEFMLSPPVEVGTPTVDAKSALEAAWASLPTPPAPGPRSRPRGVIAAAPEAVDEAELASFEQGEPTRDLRPLKPLPSVRHTPPETPRTDATSTRPLLDDGASEPPTQSYDVSMLTDHGMPAARRDGPEFNLAPHLSANAMSIPRALSSADLAAATQIAQVLESSLVDLGAAAAADALGDISVAMNRERATIRVDGKDGEAAMELEVLVQGDRVALRTDAVNLATFGGRADELTSALAEAGFTFGGFQDAGDDDHAAQGGDEADDDTPHMGTPKASGPEPVRTINDRQRSIHA